MPNESYAEMDITSFGSKGTIFSIFPNHYLDAYLFRCDSDGYLGALSAVQSLQDNVVNKLACESGAPYTRAQIQINSEPMWTSEIHTVSKLYPTLRMDVMSLHILC